MKYAINFVTSMVFGWPALIVGYVFASIKSGFDSGCFLQDRHEDAALKKFLPEE